MRSRCEHTCHLGATLLLAGQPPWLPLRHQGSKWDSCRLLVCLAQRLSRLGCAVGATDLLAVVADDDISVGRLHFSPELEEAAQLCQLRARLIWDIPDGLGHKERPVR